MARRLPPLNALRAFEAAARHLSFTRAAAELNVTQAAISHQVKTLEERLGVVLFRRLNRALRLTDAGQAYLPTVRDAFDAIAAATDRLYADDSAGRLTVSTLHSFAAAWLLPRLPRFRALHPDIDVLLDAEDKLVDLAHAGVDVAIRYGQGDWPGVRAELWMTEEIFPVCSPSLLEGAAPMRVPADLNRHTLLHDDMRVNWGVWLRATGAGDVDATTGPGFTDSRLVVQAAIAGHGVALARSHLVADDIVAGRLVRPFDDGLPAGYAYYIVAEPGSWERPKVKAFRDWLKAEAAGAPLPGPAATPDRLSGPIKTT
ncbi:MAG: transcriptional regulator GcvA [Alphaproteobacteria bacterium]|nr:transcriptional regulator GcvA [Alphaproteobacteria bacterium]